MKTKDIRRILKVVTDSDLADGKVRELACQYLGNDTGNIDILKDDLMGLVQLDIKKCIKKNQKLLTKSLKHVQ